MKKKSELIIAVISRTDIGGPGTRNNLVRAGFLRARDEGADFVVWAGGVIDHKVLNKQLQQEIADLGKEVADYNSRIERKQERRYLWEEVRDHRADFINRQARRISSLVPELRTPTGERISINIITARFFDDDLGREIVTQLAGQRADIRYFGQGEHRFLLRVLGDRWLSVLVPRKPPWRGKYYSTAVTREIEDSLKAGSRLPDFYVVGCCGSAITKPGGGEARRPYFSVPVLHKLRGVDTAENQIGIRLFKVREEAGELIVIPRTIDAKDLTTNERKSLRLPGDLSQNQRAIMRLVIEQGEQSVGSISDHLNLSEDKVGRLLERIDRGPGLGNRVAFDPTSHQFDFTQKFLRNELSYTFPNYQDLTQETLITFACMHAGHVQLNHAMVTSDIPWEIHRTKATVLAAAGDLVCGLKHDLGLRGEAYGGWNETGQEKFAAHLIAQAILGSFTLRLRDRLRQDRKLLSNLEQLKQVMAEDLVSFWYIPGNHCAWTLPSGISPLETFSCVLQKKLIVGLHQMLSRQGVNLFEFILELVDRKVFRGPLFTLPKTKLIAYMCHPSMGRTKTISIRPQEVADRADADTAQIVIDGNFHVGMSLEEWSPSLGQRVVHQVGTLLARTDFEDSKIKDVDQHFGVIRVWAKDRRIKISEVYYRGPSVVAKPLSNDATRLTLEQEYLFPVSL